MRALLRFLAAGIVLAFGSVAWTLIWAMDRLFGSEKG